MSRGLVLPGPDRRKLPDQDPVSLRELLSSWLVCSAALHGRVLLPEGVLGRYYVSARGLLSSWIFCKLFWLDHLPVRILLPNQGLKADHLPAGLPVPERIQDQG